MSNAPLCTTLIVETRDGDVWIECKTCGAAEWQSKLLAQRLDAGKLLHRTRCKTRAQFEPGTVVLGAAVAAVSAPAAPDVEKVAALAKDVRRTGLTKGRDTDVLEAVRLKHLSIDSAMNTDD